jgi:hypothetical protein
MRSRLGGAFAHGILLHLGQEVLPFCDRVTALPLSALWAAAPRGSA